LKLQALTIQDGEKSTLPREDLEGDNFNTKIELDLEIFIQNDYFSSELDKINFYREIELIDNLEELEEIKKDFLQNKVSNEDIHSIE